MKLEDELDRIFAARDRNNMQPTIEALLPLRDAHPGNALVLYEVAGAYDTAGQEENARGYYEAALAAGLRGDALRRCYLQYGSTLRNLGEHAKSREVFAVARSAFPESASLGVFEAIGLHAAGHPTLAVATLLEIAAEFIHAPDVDRYKPAIRANAAHLRSLDANGETEAR